MSVAGKVVLVTGVSSGIGLAVGQHLLESGAKVLGLDIQDLSPSFKPTSDFAFHKGDLTVSGSAEEAVAIALEKFGGRIDGLVNVAGVMDNMASVDTMDDKIYERVMAINVTAPLKLMRAVVRQMKTQANPTGGSIVNIGSQTSTSGALSGVAYTASKHAILGASKNVAYRFLKEGIRCNCVMPGMVKSGIYNLPQPVDTTNFDRVVRLTGAHGANSATDWVPAEDVATLIALLLSDASKSVNGAAIPVDAGWCAI